ncbi:MAG TPA: hypothetical protein PK926_03610 [Spirochaetota bacterium]|nr:hypothetical protein [Spirochaetota bacterium]HPI89512.1 hypothetical protein [Spirochaetota bacterium]HPR47100.1 hypothetical protein [Spirochaetota bacterium]
MSKNTIKRKDIAFNTFVAMIEQSHEDITERYMNDLLKNPDTDAYRKLDRDSVYRFSDLIYKDLSKWIAKEYPKQKIAERYIKIGKERCEQGIPFSQVQKALVLQMRHLWLFVISRVEDDNIRSVRESINLNNRVVLYFQRATFFMLKGYEQVIYKKI